MLLTDFQFILAVILGCVIEAVYTFHSQATPDDGVRAFCIVWFATGAAFFLGTVIDFLFGLPKLVLSRSDKSLGARGSGPVPGSLSDNTNLQDVSDRLTKIIIGIGIAQFETVVALFRFATNRVEFGMSPETQTAGNAVVAASALLCGAICGFLFYDL